MVKRGPAEGEGEAGSGRAAGGSEADGRREDRTVKRIEKLVKEVRGSRSPSPLGRPPSTRAPAPRGIVSASLIANGRIKVARKSAASPDLPAALGEKGCCIFYGAICCTLGGPRAPLSERTRRGKKPGGTIAGD